MSEFRSVFEFLNDLKAMPKTQEEELFEQACASIGAELLAYRKLKGLTQTQLANRLRISSRKLSRIEMGLANLSLKELARIASVLGGNLKVSLGILHERSESDE